jgi:TetR/AcrR family transcriptional regulator
MVERVKTRRAPSPPRGRNSAQSRALILEAAERIFAEAGLAGARTDAIAGAAGVNKALLYYYFKSKDELYRAVLEEHLKDFRQQALAALAAEGSAREIVLAYVSMHFDFISSRPFYPRLFHRLMMAGGKGLERLAREYFAPLARKFVALIEQGIRSGEFRSLDSNHTAISLVALTVFYFSAAPVVRVVSGLDPFNKQTLARRKEEVLKFVRYALFRDPEAPLPCGGK